MALLKCFSLSCWFSFQFGDLDEFIISIKLNLLSIKIETLCDFRMLKKAAAPSMKGEPKMSVRQNRTQIFIEMRVISTVIPNIIWMYGGKIIKMGGRYSMDIRQDGDGWIIVYQINEVSAALLRSLPCKSAPPTDVTSFMPTMGQRFARECLISNETLLQK